MSSRESRKKKKEITSIEDLPGVGAATARKLMEAGFSTIESIAVASPAELASALDIGEKTASKIIQAAREALRIEFETAEEVWEKRRKVNRITTGSKALDEILGGGVETRAITEFYGEFGVGKTQLCHQLAVNVQLPEDKGGLGKGAVYIDTENTFRPERVIEMATALGLDPKNVLRNIIYARAYSSDHQMLIISKLNDVMKKHNIGLIVVDSIISHFRAEYPGRESLVERQQKLNRHLHMLLRTADIYNAAVVITNQVIANPGVFYGSPIKPAGGHILAHISTYRVYLRKGKDNIRIARIVDSPYLPEEEAVFQITKEGIRDVA